MFKPIAGFSGFSVTDLATTESFYTEVLGLKIIEAEMGLQLVLPGGEKIFVYQKDNHEPATFTILNLVVENIDKSIELLEAKGVSFERYNMKDMPQDKKGVLRGLAAGMGPDIAWFQDPSGNILSILQEK